jgi:hypothetical protein
MTRDYRVFVHLESLEALPAYEVKVVDVRTIAR